MLIHWGGLLQGGREDRRGAAGGSGVSEPQRKGKRSLWAPGRGGALPPPPPRLSTAGWALLLCLSSLWDHWGSRSPSQRPVQSPIPCVPEARPATPGSRWPKQIRSSVLYWLSGPSSCRPQLQVSLSCPSGGQEADKEAVLGPVYTPHSSGLMFWY